MQIADSRDERNIKLVSSDGEEFLVSLAELKIIFPPMGGMFESGMFDRVNESDAADSDSNVIPIPFIGLYVWVAVLLARNYPEAAVDENIPKCLRADKSMANAEYEILSDASSRIVNAVGIRVERSADGKQSKTLLRAHPTCDPIIALADLGVYLAYMPLVDLANKWLALCVRGFTRAESDRFLGCVRVNPDGSETELTPDEIYARFKIPEDVVARAKALREKRIGTASSSAAAASASSAGAAAASATA